MNNTVVGLEPRRRLIPKVTLTGHQNGMLGVFLTAAELTARGFIVSLTARNAAGADLLVTDQKCRQSWSIQVKTRGGKAWHWIVGKRAKEFHSESHVYIFVNINGIQRPDFYVVPSIKVAPLVRGNWNYLRKSAMPDGTEEGWTVFGNPQTGQPWASPRRAVA
jgi:hypothetical protein